MDRRTMMIGTAAFATSGMRSNRAGAVNDQATPSLTELFDQFMKERLDLSPLDTTSYGLDTGERAHQKHEVDDGSLAAVQAQKVLTASQLTRLKAFDRAKLSRADALSYDVVLYDLSARDEANRLCDYGSPGGAEPYVISQLTGSYQYIPRFLANQHTIENAADAEAYLDRLSGFARVMDQELEVARHDVALGVIPPDFALSETRKQMQLLRAPDPGQNSLTQSLVTRAQEKHLTGHFSESAASIVRQQVYPALERQMNFVAEVQRHATHDAGIWRLPNGEGYYRSSLKVRTTTDEDAPSIHRLGVDLIKQHSTTIDSLLRKQGMTQGTVGARLKAMFHDPKYIFPNTDGAKDEVIAALNARVRRVRAKLPTYFGTLPKADIQIKRIPKEIEAGAPTGQYSSPSLDGTRPGIYWINMRDTAELPSWSLPTLTYHESIPGHHLQLSIQREAKLPLIRRVSFYTAYVEGWALYAEQLAAEMGEYNDDPLGLIGQLHDSMFRAVRLVIDTGIHSMRWSRDQAVRFYVDTLGDPEPSAVTEVDRYCVWPGQACSYMMGKLRFLSEREKAKARLGPRFDYRRFHDAMLMQGAVPLELLDPTFV